MTHQLAVLLTKLGNFAHHEVTNLFLGSHMIFLRNEFRKVELVSKMNPNLIAAEPVSQNLLRQIVSQTGDEDRQHLRIRFLNQPANAGLWTEIRIWIVIFVARAFRVKADHITGAFRAELHESTQ